MLPLATNIREAYKNGQDDEQNFIQNLALFLCTILKEHAILIEQKVSIGREGGWGGVGVDMSIYMSVLLLAARATEHLD